MKLSEVQIGAEYAALRANDVHLKVVALALMCPPHSACREVQYRVLQTDRRGHERVGHVGSIRSRDIIPWSEYVGGRQTIGGRRPESNKDESSTSSTRRSAWDGARVW
jgi:hypothetical protein